MMIKPSRFPFNFSITILATIWKDSQKDSTKALIHITLSLPSISYIEISSLKWWGSFPLKWPNLKKSLLLLMKMVLLFESKSKILKTLVYMKLWGNLPHIWSRLIGLRWKSLFFSRLKDSKPHRIFHMIHSIVCLGLLVLYVGQSWKNSRKVFS